MNIDDSVTILEIAGYAIESIGEIIGSYLNVRDEELDRLYALIGQQQSELITQPNYEEEI
tara:strand:- start:712 stop:891 length:180 start_codon:yes stop_codon:yes gene_type:complete